MMRYSDSARFVRSAAAALCCLTLVRDLSATPTTQDRAIAQSIFDRALELVKDAKWAEACPMFEESQRLDPALGTQFQLAKCYEGQGRFASAWTQYVEVADAAKTAGQPEKEKAARARADAVAPRVPKLKIDVASGGAGVEVKRDGAVIPKIQWGLGLPVDPGKHLIVATAPGKKSFETSIDITEAQSATLSIPALVDLAKPPTETAPPPLSTTTESASETSAIPSERAGSRRTVALVLGGVGVVGLGVGVALGVAAKSKQDNVGADCVGDRCDASGIETRKSALRTATTGTIVGGIGLAAGVTGAVLWLTSPSAPKTAYVSPTLGGISIQGRF